VHSTSIHNAGFWAHTVPFSQGQTQPRDLHRQINVSSVFYCVTDNEMRFDMNSKLIALASAATIALTAVAMPNQAEARWRGHGGGGWWIPGAVVGGLALGAIASSAYRPYYGYGPYYDNDYGPYAYEYGGGPYAYEYGGGPYYNGGPRYYYGQRYYRHWTEF
jgi:hypothetical protein